MIRPTPTAAEVKTAARTAMALTTAAFLNEHTTCDAMLDEMEDPGMVAGSLVGMLEGLLKLADQHRPGSAQAWLTTVGRGIERMAEA